MVVRTLREREKKKPKRPSSSIKIKCKSRTKKILSYVVVLLVGGGFEGRDPLLHLAAGVGAEDEGSKGCDDLERKKRTKFE